MLKLAEYSVGWSDNCLGIKRCGWRKIATLRPRASRSTPSPSRSPPSSQPARCLRGDNRIRMPSHLRRHLGIAWTSPPRGRRGRGRRARLSPGNRSHSPNGQCQGLLEGLRDVRFGRKMSNFRSRNPPPNAATT
eukprot:CAMPEP_0115270462 /NCGR_PEP_ID=MMETSP0270-20121206/53583_1 /TAXON_ID=71861 /ORGANISM="Scrippsiella trochoidea, Strain CCMP3099" /LENGTH=133 /DNA_ID=CAMNT_0002686765 /DNA_START=325 /DNA_END=726 /DNA_ORIENTATION=+